VDQLFVAKLLTERMAAEYVTIFALDGACRRALWRICTLDIRSELARVLDETLNLGPRAAGLTEATPLLGSMPELDSMAVVTIIGALEERFGISVNDDDIDGSTFATFGTLLSFVTDKLHA
jgi:acyl carrier protein